MTIDVMMIGLRSIGGGQGGVERHVASLAAEYEQLGLQTCVVVRTAYAKNDPANLGTTTWTKSIWAPQHVSLEAPVHSLLATLYAGVRRPRVLHIHAVGPSLTAPLARLLGLRVVCTHHGEDYAREKWGRVAKFVLRLGELFQARYANVRICVSKSLAARLSDHYSVPFDYIPNAVSPMRAAAPFHALEAFGLEPGRYVVHVGRLVPEKRQLDLIAAFALLGRPGYKLALVGAADHESEYSTAVKRLAAETPGVVMTGFQQGEVLAQLIGAAAVFALPSTHEGMPIAALEAMGLGRPVVLSNIPPNLDLALPDFCYHSVGSVESLVDRLREALTRHADQELPSVDWSATLVPFTWARVARQTIDAYDLPVAEPRMASQ